MIYVTEDTHGDFERFREDIFPEQKTMTKDDTTFPEIIIKLLNLKIPFKMWSFIINFNYLYQKSTHWVPFW